MPTFLSFTYTPVPPPVSVISKVLLLTLIFACCKATPSLPERQTSHLSSLPIEIVFLVTENVLPSFLPLIILTFTVDSASSTRLMPRPMEPPKKARPIAVAE